MTLTPAPGRTSAARRRRPLVVAGCAVLLAALAVVGGPWAYARFLAPAPPSALELGASTAPADGAVPSGPVADGEYRVAVGSQAGYRLEEVLSGEPVTVVGRTDEVSGVAVVQDDALVSAEVVVDVASIATDQPARDGYFRRALSAATQPDARLVVEERVDLAALAAEGAMTAEVPATLTLNGVSRPVTAVLEARRDAGGVEVVGYVELVLADHGLEAPDLGFVTVEPMGLVEVRLLLRR